LLHVFISYLPAHVSTPSNFMNVCSSVRLWRRCDSL